MLLPGMLQTSWRCAFPGICVKHHNKERKKVLCRYLQYLVAYKNPTKTTNSINHSNPLLFRQVG